MSLLWIIPACALLAVWIGTAVDIRRRRLGVWKAVGWLLVALLVPFIGALIYWLMRKPDADESERAAAAAASQRAETRDRGIDSTRPF